MRRRIKLYDVQTVTVLYGLAILALTTGSSGYTLFAVETHGNNPSRAGFPCAFRPR
ncbi:hypothetical protein CY0110_31685 [Crocosphaera chwakensis CCY0110]|uniref:Uncharacterized protein n=1 Tax=Crocosphaera chwakensis CCY0110 TaxID=391612 RepID=A3IWH3_9CHRO|nr:hypothetical protein CY0110_31685 [Crocosphaera chwakensis CCY0110]